MFFLLLIGACLSINRDSLQPIASSLPSRSLISIAKTNPLALVEMLDGADPDAIDNIVKILRTLITEGETEAKRLQDAIDSALDAWNAAKTELVRLIGVEGSLKSEWMRLRGIQNQKVGRYNALRRAYNEAEPGLSKEIDILTKVLGMLNDLLAQNQPSEKDLLELGSSEKGKAYLKLLANVQADPEKLTKIIGFVGTLLNRAQAELDDLKQKYIDADGEVKVATDNRLAAEAAYKEAKQAREECKTVVAQRDGAVKGAQQAYDVRNPVLVSEDKTLKEVIRLLLSTADPTGSPEE